MVRIIRCCWLLLACACCSLTDGCEWAMVVLGGWCLLVVDACRLVALRCLLLVACCSLFALGWLLVVLGWFLVWGCLRLSVVCWLLYVVACCWLHGACSLLSFVVC